jgi:hypothetical protein
MTNHKSLKRIRVVLDPPRVYDNGVTNDVPEDYLDFTVDITSKLQYDWFYSLIVENIAMIDTWESGEEIDNA